MPKKVSISIPDNEWGSQKTKYPPSSDFVGNTDFTAGSKNYETNEKGVITKRKGSIEYNPTPLTNPVQDQYEGIFDDGTRHLLAVQSGEVKYSSGDRVFNTITNGAGFSTSGSFEFATILDRIYMCNGINTPQVYDRQAVYGGAPANLVPRLDPMGAQAPSGALTAAVGAAGSVPAGAHTYKITFMYYGTSESNGGPASVAVNPGGPSIINLTNIPLGGHGVTSRKIYRDFNSDGVWRLVNELTDNTTVATTDNANIGTAIIPSLNSVPPTFGLITSFLDRAWIADIVGEPTVIRHSEAGQPDIFRTANFIRCNPRDPITAIAVFLDRVIVLNRNSMGQILGRTADTFRYADIQESVGCVDNRSVQVRTIQGVPTLIWLSDKGIYTYNGNSIDYISEDIEDLVNLNIQQGVQTSNNWSLTSFSGVPPAVSDGINLNDPSTITTKGPLWDISKYPSALAAERTDPRQVWDDQEDWEEGTEAAGNKTSVTNLATVELSNKMQVPTKFSPNLVDGFYDGITDDADPLKLVTRANFWGEDQIGISGLNYMNIVISPPQTNLFTMIGQSITPTEEGTLTHAEIKIKVGTQDINKLHLRVYGDDGVGRPNTSDLRYTGPFHNIPKYSAPYTLAEAVYLPVQANETLWIVAANTVPGSIWDFVGGVNLNTSGTIQGSTKQYTGVDWIDVYQYSGYFPTAVKLNYMAIKYFFDATPHPKTGQWISESYDSKLDGLATPTTMANLIVSQASVFPATTSSKTWVEGTNSIAGPWTVVSLPAGISNLSGDSAPFLPASAYRYWRIRVQLSTTDDRSTPTVDLPKLKFTTAGTWISEAIDCTGDCTSYDSLTLDSSIPGGTSIITEVRTATTQPLLAGAPWVAFGAAVIQQWLQVRLTLNTNAGNDTTPVVTSLDFKYTVTSTYTSISSDTGTTPAGWGVFQETSLDNGGTLLFQMRSDVAPLPADPASIPPNWYTVTNGNLPPVGLPIAQYVQWKSILTSSAGLVPEVDAVTLNWLLSGGAQPIRVASLFFNRQYTLAAAELGTDYNNLAIVLDGRKKWRIQRDININTIGLFFNTPYYGDSTAGTVYKLNQGLVDKGVTPVEFDMRTRAFDFSTQYADNRSKLKVIRQLVLTARNTGATLTPQYSIDEGSTWNSLYDDNGNASFVTSIDNSLFVKRLKAQHNIGIPTAGYTIMFRLTSNDMYKVEIHKLKLEALLRKGEPIG